MHAGHAFQAVLPKPQLIQFSRLLFKKERAPAPSYCVTAHCPGCVFVHVWEHIFSCLTIIVLYTCVACEFVRAHVCMHVRVLTRLAGFFI